MKVLNVASNQRAAETIVRHLVGDCSRERRNEGPKTYEFITEVDKEPWCMIMTSVSGYMMEYQYSNPTYRPFNCDLSKLVPLFEETVQKVWTTGGLKVKEILETEVLKNHCDALIVWTNYNRDGDSIANEVIEVCRAMNPNIKIYRAKYRELTAEQVQLALDNLCEHNKAISDAIDVRRELDFRTGRAFTRFQTGRVKTLDREACRQRSYWTYGSCQFPILSFLVERRQEILDFQSEPSETVQVTDEWNGVLVEFEREKNNVSPEVAKCDDPTVNEVSCKPKQKSRPLPLNTSEFVQHCSDVFKYPAKRTLDIAQRLYNLGVITNPQTQATRFSPELDLASIVKLQIGNPKWGVFAERVLKCGPSPRMQETKCDDHDDEPPIYPTEYINTLEGDEARVYEFVVRRFLACLSQDAEYEETIVTASVSGRLFAARGIRITAKNYLEVYCYENFRDLRIHKYEERQAFTPNIKVIHGKTSPPDPLTECELISLMIEQRIGTISTYSNHIANVLKMGYASVEEGKKIVPTRIGLALFRAYKTLRVDMIWPSHRRRLEEDIAAICNGAKDKKAVLSEYLAKYRKLMSKLLKCRSLWDYTYQNSESYTPGDYK